MLSGVKDFILLLVTLHFAVMEFLQGCSDALCCTGCYTQQAETELPVSKNVSAVHGCTNLTFLLHLGGVPMTASLPGTAAPWVYPVKQCDTAAASPNGCHGNSKRRRIWQQCKGVQANSAQQERVATTS